MFSNEVLTVWGACAQYVKHLREEDGDTKADAEEARLLRLVKGTRLARIEPGKLRPEHARRFLSLVRGRR